ncbi:MAG: DMT family transporter [bacterium]|nr:DMT family transporter [bacterium]
MNKFSKRINELGGDALVTFAMLIFGSYALFIKLLPAIPVISFLFAMQVVGAVSFFILAARSGFPKTNAKAWWLLLALALATTANDLVYFWAFRLTSVANASVAHQLVSVFLLFLAPLFLGDKTKKNEWITLAIALVGVFILFGSRITLSSNDTLGIILGLSSALFYALFVLIYRYMPTQGYTIDFMNFWRYTLSTAILLPFIPYFGGFRVLYQNFWSLAAFGILFAVIASRIHNLGISRTRPLHVTIIGKSEPVIATFYAFLFLGQIPPLSALLGGALIIGASVWLAKDSKGE